MVGAPTPAPVAPQAEFIPGYFAGDSCATLNGVQEDSHGGISVGARIKYGDDIGTVRYIGQVAGYSGLWYGAEWDDVTRGRHSGCVNGIQYFRTSQPGAGSFVRPNRIAPIITCADAIHKHYADKEDEPTAAHCKTVINEWKREMGAPFIEMVGFEKIFKKQGNLEQLKEASVRDECVGSAGEVGALCPALQVLDVSRNLFSNWREIITLSAQLPLLADLDLSKNRLAIEMSEDALLQNSVHFLSLEKLNLSHCAYTWRDISALSNLWPHLQELIVAHNCIGKISPLGGSLDALTTLRLDGNEIEEWREVLNLGKLRNLKVLSLNDCGLSEVRIPEEAGLFPALEVLLLNRNHIADWRSISELGKLPELKKLYFLKNPVQATEDYDTVSQLVIAKIPTLQELNGSKVSREVRRGAEYDYLKRYGGECKSSSGDTEAAQLFRLNHPRFHLLIQKYGLPEDSLLEKLPKHTSLTSKLLEIHLKDEAGTVHTKKFPSNMIVQKLATMAQRLFRSAGNTGLPELFYLDKDRGDTEIPLNNRMKDLNYFSVRDGDTILVRW